MHLSFTRACWFINRTHGLNTQQMLRQYFLLYRWYLQHKPAARDWALTSVTSWLSNCPIYTSASCTKLESLWMTVSSSALLLWRKVHLAGAKRMVFSTFRQQPEVRGSHRCVPLYARAGTSSPEWVNGQRHYRTTPGEGPCSQLQVLLVLQAPSVVALHLVTFWTS